MPNARSRITLSRADAEIVRDALIGTIQSAPVPADASETIRVLDRITDQLAQ